MRRQPTNTRFPTWCSPTRSWRTSAGRSSRRRKDGYNATSVELPIEVAGSSLHAGHYEGWAQLVVDEDRKVLLGATFAGPDVAELLHAATIAVVGRGAAGPALARRALLPHHQRGLAAAAGEVRPGRPDRAAV